MSNVHGLFSGRGNDSDDSDGDENNRYVGGIGDQGGGSGLAVQPNTESGGQEGFGRDAIFGVAENATSEDNARVRRTITMYRDGFTVDDGPYRRLDDPENGEFLRSLAMGRTPRELVQEEGGNVTVGLEDKRNEDYVETFRSFSGQGTSLGGTTATVSSDGTFDPSVLPEAPAIDESQPTTSIAVRLLNGKRKVVKINTSATVATLASHLRDVETPFRLSSGFPPKLLQGNISIEDAGLKGAQVSMQKA